MNARPRGPILTYKLIFHHFDKFCCSEQRNSLPSINELKRELGQIFKFLHGYRISEENQIKQINLILFFLENAHLSHNEEERTIHKEKLDCLCENNVC